MHEAGEVEIPALLLAIAIVALVSLGIFHRAKAISARNLEIRKLQRLAAEEVARVEAAAAEEYTSMLAISNNFASCTQSETSHSLMKQSAPTITDAVEKHVRAVDNIQFTSSDVCIVCSTPTSRRCSRCKLVKYCSTDCQVLHWREGHKLECRAPETPPSENKTLLAGASPDYAKQIVANNPESCISFVEEKPAPARTPRTLAIAAPDGSLLKPSKILFPYEYFVEYFHWDRLPLTPCGLINCGNSCFANVVLQCLTYTRPLAAYLLQGNHTEECRRSDWCFMCELQSHVFRVKESQSPFSPIRILSRIQNIGNHLGYGRQEDAHEFMRFAIDSMQSICLDEVGGEKAVDPRTQETTFIQHIFGGHLQSQVKCMQCHHESDRYENMMDLAVEIQGNVESLEDALAQFTTPEWLDGENKYKCDRCNAYVKARKHLTVHEAPNILMIALKRFQSGKFGKLNKRVSFPEVLDMSPYMSGKGDMPPHYQLYAVVVHVDMLNASFFGHYICYVKDLHGSWYKVDDSNVKEVDLEKVMQQKAYMLLYTRSVPRPPPDVDGSGKSSTPVLVNDSCRLGTKLFPNGAYSRAPDMPFRSTLSNGVSKANGSISSLAGGTRVASCEVPNMCLREDSCSLNVSSLTNLRGASTEGCQSTSYDESSDIYNSDGMKNLAIYSTNPSCHLLEFKSSLEVITNLVQLPEGMCESHLPVAFPEKTGKQGAEKIGKHGVCSGLSPLPTPKPLGTDQLPTWPAASHNRSFSCPAVIHSSLEHVSSSILVPDTCRPQRKRIKGEVGFSNPVRPLHLKKMEVLEPADSLNSVAYSQHKIKRGILASPLQHNGETYACISEVIEGAGSSEISMDVGSGVIARDLPASQHGVAELSLNLENLNNEDHYDHLSTINGDLAILDEYQKQANANMVDWVAPVDMACVINHRPDLCRSQSVEELDLVNMAANMAKTSESSEFPSFDTVALEDSCTGMPSYVYSQHLSDKCNEDHLQGVGRFSSRREFNSTNSDESGIASTSESGFLPSLAGLFEVPSQKASLTFLGERSTVRNLPDHSVIINEMSNTEPGDKMLELKPMFKPGFLNRSVRHQPRIKSGDEKANGVVTGCLFPNRSSSFGNGISVDNSSTYSSGGSTSGIEMGSTGVPCASADDKVGSRDEVALRQVVNAKSRCMDTIVTSNTGDSCASMGSEVQSFADVGTSETLSERETPVAGDRDIENSRCAINFSNNSIPTVVNGTFLISEPRNQLSGSRIPQDLTDETMQSLKDNMQNQTLCANRRKPKIGSNESCTCGSHEKWKKCCGRAEILGRHLVV